MVDGTQVALVAIPVVGTLGGVVVGRWMEQRHESRRWLRDAKLRIYTGMVKGAGEILQAVRDIGEGSTGERRATAAKRYARALESFRVATDEAQLVGSLQVWQKLVEFNTTTNALNTRLG